VDSKVGDLVSREDGQIESPPPRSRLFVPALVVGWALIAVGTTRALGDERDSHPFALLVHIVAFDLGHDLIVAPVAVALCWLIGKLAPQIARGPLRGASAASAIFILFAVPLVRRWGRRPTNSSTLPLNYGVHLPAILIVVWSTALVVVLVRRNRQKRLAQSIDPPL
jgi:hypothetical protein